MTSESENSIVTNDNETNHDINYDKNNNVIDSDADTEQYSDSLEGESSGAQKEESRFKDGQILKFVKVRFPGNAKAFPFFIGKRQFQYGLKVVAMSDRGMMVGYINSFPYEKSYGPHLNPVRSIARVASLEDLKQQDDFISKEKEAEVMCIDLIEKYRLDMVLTHVEYTQFGKKAVFFFTAPARVDFRDLVKDLVAKLKMRIELRQISVRDRAAAIGGIGACGLQTCCSSFLSAYGNVSIKMAKNQNLALVPSKLNGVCGQIKCCIKYEDEVYSEKRTKLPKENSLIQLKNGDFGKVVQLNIIEEQFELLTNKGTIKRYIGALHDPSHAPEANCTYPESFEHVANETKTVINFENCGPLLEKFRPIKVVIPEPELEKIDAQNANKDEEIQDEFENEEEVDEDLNDQDSREEIKTETKDSRPETHSKVTDSQDKSKQNHADAQNRNNNGPINKEKGKNFHKFKKKNKRK